MQAGVVAVKSFARAKARFEGWLDPQGRELLARALLEDQLALLAAVPSVHWFVVSDDEAIAERAREEGHAPLRDRGVGLNEALGLAIREALSVGASSLLMMPGDVPLTTPEDIDDILDTAATSDVVVVPSNDGGTAALCVSPPGALEPAFGEHSLQRHLQDAERAGLRCALLPLERMAIDIDTPEDAKELMRRSDAETSSAGTLLRRLIQDPGSD